MNNLLRKGKNLLIIPVKKSTEDLQEYLFFLDTPNYKKGQTIAFREHYEVYGPGQSIWKNTEEVEHIWPGTWGY